MTSTIQVAAVIYPVTYTTGNMAMFLSIAMMKTKFVKTSQI